MFKASDINVGDHFQVTGRYRGLALEKKHWLKKINCFCYQKSFDVYSKFESISFIKTLILKKPKWITEETFPSTTEHFTAVSYGSLMFRDSNRFLSSKLTQ